MYPNVAPAGKDHVRPDEPDALCLPDARENHIQSEAIDDSKGKGTELQEALAPAFPLEASEHAVVQPGSIIGLSNRWG